MMKKLIFALCLCSLSACYVKKVKETNTEPSRTVIHEREPSTSVTIHEDD